MNRKRIAVIATSNSMGVMPQDLIDIGLVKLNVLGFDVVFGKNVNNNYFGIAGLREDRLADLNWALNANDIDIVMPVFGGYNCAELLDGVDYSAIKEKMVVGYSDITSLINDIYARTGRTAYHGPGFAKFCDPNISEETVQSFMQAVNGDHNTLISAPEKMSSDLWFIKKNYGPREWRSHPTMKALCKGRAQGKLVGGTMETLLSLNATPYQVNYDDKVLLLETSYKTSVSIFKQWMTQFSQQGVFDRVAGVVFGTFSLCSELAEEQILEKVLSEYFCAYDKPVAMHLPSSHADPIYTLPIGGDVELYSGDLAWLKII
ncbi:S66 peptidase family protein [Marinimicrobium locisalis]|uniref:S66 peptidase family protein n=1 Tax=Marinimicrobium locisalis TaxID=546022 RepID=UPI003221AA7E